MRRRECLLVLSLAAVAAVGSVPGDAWCADKPFEPFMGAWMNVSGLVGRSADTSARERSIAENLDQFKASGLRVIIPFVTTTNGQAEYPSQVIPDKMWGAWDPVAAIVREARKRGLQVWPAMCVMACGSKEPRGILKQHPEWALRDKAGNPMGYLSAGNPEARKYVVSALREIDVYLEIAKRAGVNGAAIFTWHTLEPYLPEVKQGNYFEKFEAGLKPTAW